MNTDGREKGQLVLLSIVEIIYEIVLGEVARLEEHGGVIALG